MSSKYRVQHGNRAIPRISLRDFDARIDEITAELVAAAETYGCFVLADHPVPQSAIDAQSLSFVHACHSLGKRLMVCLARGLGLADVALGPAALAAPVAHTHTRACRAGPHADGPFLTLLFQRSGQSGLEICLGHDAVADVGDAWTEMTEMVEMTEIQPAEIVCSIGDLLMFWQNARQPAVVVPPVEFQAATSFSPCTGSMDAGDSAAASAAYAMAACMASASAMTASMM